MNITILLTAPDDITVSQRNCDLINEVIESLSLDYTMSCEPSSSGPWSDDEIVFDITRLSRLDMARAMELVHELVFEEFSEEFE